MYGKNDIKKVKVFLVKKLYLKIQVKYTASFELCRIRSVYFRLNGKREAQTQSLTRIAQNYRTTRQHSNKECQSESKHLK